MKTAGLSRKEKEEFYIRTVTELHARWGNPHDADWQFLRDISDEELDSAIRTGATQLRFEKRWRGILVMITWAVLVFAVFVATALLFFGIRTIF